MQYNTGDYKSGLQALIDDGKANLDDTLDHSEAQKAIDEIGIDFGEYRDEFTGSIVGLTRIEAFAHLREVFERLDKSDGSKDGKVDTKTKPFSEILDAAGLGEGSHGDTCFHGDSDGNNQDEVNQKLNEASDVFRRSDNPSDSEYIDTFKAAQNGTGGGLTAPIATFTQHQEKLDQYAPSELRVGDDPVDGPAQEASDQQIDQAAGSSGCSSESSDSGQNSDFDSIIKSLLSVIIGSLFGGGSSNSPFSSGSSGSSSPFGSLFGGGSSGSSSPFSSGSSSSSSPFSSLFGGGSSTDSGSSTGGGSDPFAGTNKAMSNIGNTLNAVFQILPILSFLQGLQDGSSSGSNSSSSSRSTKSPRSSGSSGSSGSKS